MRTFFLSALCSLLSLSTLHAAATLDKPAALSETFTNNEKNYSISYPTGWNKNDVPGLDLVLFGPRGSDDPAHASMNVVSENLGSEISLDQFYSESVSNLSNALKDVQVEKTGSATLNGATAKWILYTHVMQNIKFRVLQYFIVSNTSVYLLTFSSTADSFERYKKEFEAIANSFKIANRTPSAK